MPHSRDRSYALDPQEAQRVEQVDRLAASGDVEALAAALDDASWKVRRSVVAALAAQGDAAVGPLCEVLRQRRDDEARLAAAVDALSLSTGDPFQAVAGLTRDPNPAVVADAAQILGRRRDPVAVPSLVQLAGHDDDNVALAALEGLSRIGGRAAVDLLVATIRSGNFFRAFPAIDILGRSGDPRAIEPLAELLDDPTYAVEATRALGRTGDRAAVGPLASLLLQAGTEAAARLAAAALTDLHRAYERRYGDPIPVEEALRKAAQPRDLAVRSLSRAATADDPLELEGVALLLSILGGEEAAALLATLLEEEPTVAAAAAQALERLESEATLVRTLREGDSAHRLAVLPVVRRTSSAPAIVACLQDANPAVRAAACAALARIGHMEAVPAVFRLLSDENLGVVKAAEAAVQALDGPDAERLALAAARGAQARQRCAGLRILSYFGYDSALEALVQATADPDPRVREAAIEGLPGLQDRHAFDTLLEASRHTEERTRAAAMRALGRAGRRDMRVVSYLLGALDDPGAWVRYYACQSLGRIGVEDAGERIARLLRDPAGQVRIAAIEALSHLRSQTAFEALRRAAASEDPDVQRAALIGLGLSEREEALPFLLAGIRASDAATRLVATSTIAHVRGEKALAALREAASDPDPEVWTAAVNLLAVRPGSAATGHLVALLQEALQDRPERRERVLAALDVQMPGRLEGVLAALETADDELAPELASLLVRLGQEGHEALLRALNLDSPAARRAAVTALGATDAVDARAALGRLAKDDPDPEVRRVAALVLER